MRFWGALLGAVAAPGAAMRDWRHSGKRGLGAVSLLVSIMALGALTVPRQLQLLHRALAPTGNPMRDTHHAALVSGLTRFIVFDRLVPPPTLLLAAMLVVIVAEPALALGESHRREIRGVILLGLVPLVVQRIGELAITYLAPVPGALPPGIPVTLPQQFVTGPALFWWDGEAPAWIQALSARANMISLWAVGLWTVGLRELDGQPFSVWHVVLPVFCLTLAGLITWWAGPMVMSLVLGGS